MVGTVRDAHGDPLADAEVRLRSATDGREAPVRVDATGRWSTAGLEPGIWEITVRAPEHLDVVGTLTVGPRTHPVDVRMRPLEEVPPRGAETPQSVVFWIEKGNVLLDRGQAAEARELFGRALPLVDVATRLQLHAAIARASFQEGDAASAATELQRGLVLAPRDQSLRELLRAVAPESADAWLDRLDAEGRDVLAAELPAPDAGRQAPDRRPPPRPDRIEPTAEARGRFLVSFRDGSVVSDVETLAERLGEPQAAEVPRPPLDAESFDVFVPSSYRPDGSWGLFVWVSPMPEGGTARPEIHAALAEAKLIWIGAVDAGNGRAVRDRVALALDGATAMQGLYSVDPERVWASGYSGGGRVASALAVAFPEVFRGAFCWYGVDFYEPVPAADRPGAHWPAGFAPPPRGVLRDVRRSARLVLLTGSLDFNHLQTHVMAERYLDAGFRHVEVLEIPGADHYHGLDAEYLLRGVAALEGR